MCLSGWSALSSLMATTWSEIERRARIGADVGDGWKPIALEAHERIEALHPGYVILQVKEKFGGLRFCTEFDQEKEVSEIIAAAERRALDTCEMCGATEGVTTEGSWVKTLCRSCRRVG